jgi:hypothetical protein
MIVAIKVQLTSDNPFVLVQFFRPFLDLSIRNRLLGVAPYLFVLLIVIQVVPVLVKPEYLYMLIVVGGWLLTAGTLFASNFGILRPVTPETAAMFPPLTFTLPLMVGIRYQFFH